MAWPERIGPYVATVETRRGGGGVVWRGRHEATGAWAALKAARDVSPRQRVLLRREISMLARLSRARHPGVVRFIEHGIDGGRLWYAMEYVEGDELGAFARARWPHRSFYHTQTSETADAIDRPLRHDAGDPAGLVLVMPANTESTAGADDRNAAGGQLDLVLWLLGNIASTLAFLHDEGVVHGDVTPANVIVRPNLVPVVVDFGTAFHTSTGAEAREVAQVEGVVLGTPGYMAPEQIRGDLLDARCDLYALGCIAYELCTGRPPFLADDMAALNRQHLYLPPAPLSTYRLDVPEELDKVVLELLEKDPRQRLGHAHEVLQRLERLYRGTDPFPKSSSATSLYRPRLVGREEPIDWLQGLLGRAYNGQGGLALVCGESGAGKTRLLNEIGARAIAMGMEVISGQCVEPVAAGSSQPSPESPSDSRSALRGPALHAFTPFLQRLADTLLLSSTLVSTEAMRDAIDALAPYESGLSDLGSSDSEKSPVLPPDLAAARVLRSLTAVLTRFANPKPLLILIDDLQWADEITLSYWTSTHAEDLAKTAVLVVAACRDKEGDSRLAAWLAAHPNRQAHLSRLGIEQIRAMTKDMLATDLSPPGLAEFLYHHTEGNPFFVAEYMRALIQRRSLHRTVHGWEFSTSPDEEADSMRGQLVPAALRDLLESRFEGLSGDAVTVLTFTAILGKEFRVEHLETFLADTQFGTPDKVAAALDELEARQILEIGADRRCRFVHDKLREAATRRIAAGRVPSLHRQVAEQLESIRSAALSEPPRVTDAELGLHWSRAEEPLRALTYLEKAGQEAEAVHAVSQATELYRLAVREAENLRAHSSIRPPEDSPRPGGSISPRAAADLGHVRLMESLADLLARSAHHGEARALYGRVLQLIGTGDRLRSARVLRKTAQSFWTVHRYDEASAALEQADGCLRSPDEVPPLAYVGEWIEIQQSRYWTLYFGRKTGNDTLSLLQATRPVVDAHGTELQRCVFYQCVATDMLGRARYVYSDEAVAQARRGVDEVKSTNRFSLEHAIARFQVGFALVVGGRDECAEAAGILSGVARDAERFGDATLLARAQTYRAVALRRIGEVERTLSVAREAAAAAETARLFPYLGAAAACASWVAWRRGQLDHALADARAAWSWWGRSDHVFPFRWLADFPLLEMHCSRDEFESAESILNDLLQPQQQLFRAPIQSALESALEICRGGAPADIGRALRHALELAREEGYS